MTNLERIRQLPAEELAKMLIHYDMDYENEYYYTSLVVNILCYDKETAIDEVKKWLLEEYK